MPLYVYETIPQDAKSKPRQFEMRQGMTEAPLQQDPETGLPVRRVISGGLEIPRGKTSARPAPSPATCNPHGGGCACCH
jgi:hypothetical protein